MNILALHFPTSIPTDHRKKGEFIDFLITHNTRKLREVKTVNALNFEHFPLVAELGSYTARTWTRTKTNWVRYCFAMQDINDGVNEL